MYDIKFKPGDLCVTTYLFLTKEIVLITDILEDTHYEYEREDGIFSRCHVASIMSHSFKLLCSDISSIEEARKVYPEYFV